MFLPIGDAPNPKGTPFVTYAAISGVLGFYFVLFPRNIVRVLVVLPPFLLAGEGGVAHGAPIGGFLAGGAAAWCVDRQTVDRRRVGRLHTPTDWS